MIMPRGQQLLLPVRPLFIWCSLIAALALDMLLNMGWFGRADWVPDVLAVVLVFWTVHQPLRIGIGSAFSLGLIIDIHQSSLLGQHAMAYTALCYLAIAIHRRLLWFTVPSQSAQVFPIFFTAHLVALIVRAIAGDGWPNWTLLMAPLVESLLWPVVSVVLLLPQKQAPNPDANRPL